jgi:hypothetical protein
MTCSDTQMRIYTAVICGMTLASCASASATLGAIPNSRQVLQAVDQDDFKQAFATVNCGGSTECYNSRQKVKVRNIACKAMSAGKAHCSYEVSNSAGDGWKSNKADFEVGTGLDGKTAWLLNKPN